MNTNNTPTDVNNQHRQLFDFVHSKLYIDSMTLGQRLKTAREFAKLTQAGLETQSGVRQQVISKIERGIQNETASIVPLAKACGVNPVWLDSGEGDMIETSSPKNFLEKLYSLQREYRDIPEDQRGLIDAAISREKELQKILGKH